MHISVIRERWYAMLKDALVFPLRGRESIKELLKASLVVSLVLGTGMIAFLASLAAPFLLAGELPAALTSVSGLTAYIQPFLLPVAAGALIFLISVLLFHVLLAGYLVEAALATIYGYDHPPSLMDLKDVTVNGLIVVGCFILVSIPGAMGGAISLIGDSMVVDIISFSLVVIDLGLFLSLPMISLHMVMERRLDALTDITVFRSTLLNLDMLKAWVYVILFTVLLAIPQFIVSGVLTLTMIGILLLPAVIIYEYLFWGRLFGTVYRKHRDEGSSLSDRSRYPREGR